MLRKIINVLIGLPADSNVSLAPVAIEKVEAHESRWTPRAERAAMLREMGIEPGEALTREFVAPVKAVKARAVARDLFGDDDDIGSCAPRRTLPDYTGTGDDIINAQYMLERDHETMEHMINDWSDMHDMHDMINMEVISDVCDTSSMSDF